MDEPSLQALLDRQAIAEVVLRYTRGLDRMDWALVASCYHPDAYHDHGMWKGPAQGFVRYCAQTLPSMDRTLHIVHNTLVALHDATHAAAESYCSALHRVASTKSAGGYAQHDVYVRYIDRFERRTQDDGRVGPWLIARRDVVFEWTKVEPIGREWKLAGEYQRGARSRSDPAYAAGVLPQSG